MDQAQLIGIALGVGIVAVFLLIVFIKANMVICQPNEVVILAGRTRKLADGTVLGYRVIRGGKGFKRPFVESVKRLPLTTRTVDIHLTKVLCAGMIPVNIEGRANVKLAGREEEGLENAVERFLGKGTEAVDKTAKQVLEGSLRGIVASVSPEEANAQRLEIAGQVVTRAREDLDRLGIVLDFFQIQSITDDEGYLEAIGRKRNAEVSRDARIAEAEAEAEARQVAAEQIRIGREAEIASEKIVIQRENELAVERADLAAKANEAEGRAAVAGEVARAEIQIELEAKRAEVSLHREQADTVVPAEARQKALALEAEGKASRILENGRAMSEAVELMQKQVAGGASNDLFLIQMLPGLLDKVTRVMADNLRVDKLTILDGGDGEGLPNYVRNLSKSAIAMLEQVENATDIDVAKLASSGSDTGADLPQEMS
ncbi:MAG: flotillin family protein [Planctomycetota bacterium]|jgi:flotillin